MPRSCRRGPTGWPRSLPEATIGSPWCPVTTATRCRHPACRPRSSNRAAARGRGPSAPAPVAAGTGEEPPTLSGGRLFEATGPSGARAFLLHAGYRGRVVDAVLLRGLGSDLPLDVAA